MSREVELYVGEALGRYGFPHGHPFGPDRQDAFWKEAEKQGLPRRVSLREPREATREEIERFHKHEHVERVRVLSVEGYGSIDYGDTPAYPGVYDASANVVGAALNGLERVMNGETLRTFSRSAACTTRAARARPGSACSTIAESSSTRCARRTA
jgi:acetoin utilization protein AcuC